MLAPFRIGIGYDVHRTAAQRPLVLGGVHIESEFGLLGHSDADVLSHAIADAILGAAGLPDIGHYFPPDDPQWEGMDSQVILHKALQESLGGGYRLGNVDAVVIAEAPRIGPHIVAMKRQLAQTLGLDPGLIGIKATTHEQLGALGKGEGIAAQAVALLFSSR